MNALVALLMASIVFNAPTTVGRFMRSNAFVRAIVGPIGSGKSSGCVMEILRRAMEQEPDEAGVRHTRFAVIRNTYRQLEDTTRKTFEQWIPELAGKWEEQAFTFVIKKRLPDGTRVNCEILFRALDKPSDVKKVLSLELTGAYINEGREIPKEIIDGLQGRVGRFPAKKDGGATWFGIWMDSNAWATTSWAYDLFNRNRPPGFELFEQPDGLSAAAENVANLPDGYYPRLVHGKDTEWIDEYIRARYPKADKGSIYGKLMAALEERGLRAEFAHSVDEVFTAWDIGHSDNTSIWFFRFDREAMFRDFEEQLRAGVAEPEVHVMVDVIDHYSNHGEAVSHYFGVLRERAKPVKDGGRGYVYRKHWLPHDARHTSFQTGVSTLDLCIKEWGADLPEIAPELDVEDGIGAVRWLLEQRTRIHPRCDTGQLQGVRALAAYRYAWDDDKKAFSKKPVHDWASHCSDAFRYLAVAVQLSEEATRPPMKPKKQLLEKPAHQPTEEELLEPPEISFG